MEQDAAGELLVVAVLAAGLVFVFSLYVANPPWFQDYVENHPKMAIWRQLFGRDRAYTMIRTRVSPRACFC